jgi:hypothetical protein
MNQAKSIDDWRVASYLKRQGVSFGLVVTLVVVLAFILRLWLALTLPTSSLPDEESHFAYVTFVAKNWRPPRPSDALSQGNSIEFIQPPTYYFAATLIYNLAVSFGMSSGFYSLRVLSVSLSIAAIIVGYKAIQKATVSRITLLSSLLLMAFTPKVVLVSVGINNDQLSWFFSAVVIYYMVQSINRWPKPVAMGTWSGLAVVTKLINIPFVFGGLASCLLGISYSTTVRQGGLQALKYLVVLSIMSSWLFFWNLCLFGTPIPVASPTHIQNKLYRFFLPNLASLSTLQATPTDVRYQWQAQLQPNILWGNLATLFSFWLDSRTVSSWPKVITNWLQFWGGIVSLLTLIIILGVYSNIRKTGAASYSERRVSFAFFLVVALFIAELNLFSYVVWQTANGRLLYFALPLIAFFFGSGVSFLCARIQRSPFHLQDT